MAQLTPKDAEMRGATLYAKLLLALRDGPVSLQQAADISGLHYSTVQRYVRALFDVRLVHRPDWTEDRTGVRRIPLWLLGDGPNVRMPRMSKRERNELLAARRRQSRALAKQAALAQALTGGSSNA